MKKNNICNAFISNVMHRFRNSIQSVASPERGIYNITEHYNGKI